MPAKKRCIIPSENCRFKDCSGLSCLTCRGRVRIKALNGANICPSDPICNENSVGDQSWNNQNKSTNFPAQVQVKKNSSGKKITPLKNGQKKEKIYEQFENEETNSDWTDDEKIRMKNANYETDDEDEIVEDPQAVNSFRNTESSSSKRLNNHDDTTQNTSKRQKVQEAAQADLHYNVSSKSVIYAPIRVEKTKSMSGKVPSKSRMIIRPRQVPTSSTSAVSKLSNQVKSLSNEVKHLEKEIEELKKTKTSSNLRNLTAFEGNNVSCIHSSKIVPSARTFVTEEDNSQLREDIKELRKNISKTEKELTNAKSSMEKKNYKEKLKREIKKLEKSCEDVEKLREINCKQYKKTKYELEKVDNRVRGRFSSTSRNVDYHRATVASLKRELESFNPKPPKPKPDPYKTTEHLSKHYCGRLSIETYKSRARPLLFEIPNIKGVIEKNKNNLAYQKKKEYIDTAVLNALKRKHRQVKDEWLPPVGLKEEDEFVKELKELEESVRKKAEEEYEEELKKKLEELEESKKLEKDNEETFPNKPSETQPGCSQFPRELLPRYSQFPIESQPGCSQFPIKSQPGCSQFPTKLQSICSQLSSDSQSRSSQFPTKLQSRCSQLSSDSQPGNSQFPTKSQSKCSQLSSESHIELTPIVIPVVPAYLTNLPEIKW